MYGLQMGAGGEWATKKFTAFLKRKKLGRMEQKQNRGAGGGILKAEGRGRKTDMPIKNALWGRHCW